MNNLELIKDSWGFFLGFAIFCLMIFLAMINLELRDRARQAKEEDNSPEHSGKKRWSTILISVVILLLIPIVDIVRGRDIAVVFKAWLITIVIATVALLALNKLFSVARRKQ